MARMIAAAGASMTLAAAAAVLVGCGPDVIHAPRSVEMSVCERRFEFPDSELCARVQREFACTDPAVAITPLGAGGYRTRACGRTDVFVCVSSAYGGYACTREAADPQAPDAGR